MESGIHDISIERYHSSLGISRSALMAFRKTPLHYHWEYVLGNKKEQSSEALLFGNALHTHILEPNTFNDRFFVGQKFDRRTKIGKEMFEAQELEAAQTKRQLINADMLQDLQNMAKSVSSNSLANGLISGGNYEKSIYWIDAETGLLCKCRPDILHNNCVADLKTANCANPKAFQRSLYDYGYHIQAGMMYEGLKAITGREYKDFVFVVVEKEAPYATVCYQLDELALLQGIADFKESLRSIKECIDSDNWPSYENQVITLPPWIQN